MALNIINTTCIVSGLGLVTTGIAVAGFFFLKSAALSATAATVSVVAVNVLFSIGSAIIFATVCSVVYGVVTDFANPVDFLKGFAVCLAPVTLIIISVYAIALGVGVSALVVGSSLGFLGLSAGISYCLSAGLTTCLLNICM